MHGNDSQNGPSSVDTVTPGNAISTPPQVLPLDGAEVVLPGEEFPSQFWTAITIDQAMDNLLGPARRTTRLEIEDDHDTFREVVDFDGALDPKSSTAMTRKLNAKKDQIFGSSSSIPFLPGGFIPKLSAAAFAVHDHDLDLDAVFRYLEADADLAAPATPPVLSIEPNPDVARRIASATSDEAPADDDDAAASSLTVVANLPELLTSHTRLINELEVQMLDAAVRKKEEMRARRSAVQREVGDLLAAPGPVVTAASIFGPSEGDDVMMEETTRDPVPAEAKPGVEDKVGEVAASDDVDQLLAADSGPRISSQRFAFDEKLKPKADINLSTVVKTMAIEYPFELDSFQQQAILHLEKGESVFVAAHTSAGKTVVAEYAIALCRKHMTKAIYTSPIKTLSNQKFREFRRTFEDVGLITGDVQINPDASCLIVTTEILRSMLYKGADVIRDIEWCIFDEVHYLNDPERGVVWEEVIIMLPAHVNVILLSATVPNPLEFAEWVGRTKRKPIYVISTTQRPVPLQHYLWCNDKMYNIVDAASNWVRGGVDQIRTDMSKKARQAVTTQKRGGGGGGGAGPGSNWNSLLNELDKNKQLPVVVFSFSKRMCEASADGLRRRDLTDSSAKHQILVLCETSLERLPECDRTLPQIGRVQDLLSRGIGVHHSGLLPVVKELVEMAFAKGLVRILFATETFAMGVNMPTKTVVFNGLRKHDGTEFRDLRPGEYTQMAGRAGRRGLDEFGNVVINCSDGSIPDQTLIRHMILGEPTALRSKFRLTFSMIVNLLRVEELRVEDMIKRSFSEFHTQRNESQNLAMITQDERALTSLPPIDCIYGEPDLIQDYCDLQRQRDERQLEIVRWIMSSPSCDHFLKPGRVVIVSVHNVIKAIGAVIGAERLSGSRTLKVFIPCPPRWTPTRQMTKTARSEENALLLGTSRTGVQYLITTMRPSNVHRICNETIRVDENEIVVEQRADHIQRAIDQLQMIDRDSVQELHPIRDMKLREMDFVLKVNALESLPALESSKCHACPKRDEHVAQVQDARKIAQRLDKLRYLVSDNNVELIANMKERIAVLQRLNYVGDDRTLLLKGRVACEINTCDCLIVTELIFENVFSDIEPYEAAAVLSCLIFQGKTDDVPKLDDRMAQFKQRMVDIATSLGNLQLECGMDVTAKSYIKDNCNFGLMEVVYEWAKGTSFASICEITTVDEGLIVRCIVRLVEVCRDVRNAARVIGDPKLFQLMDRAAASIRRDIVFAASLYVT